MEKKKDDKKELFAIQEVAELLGVHQQTLRRWDNEGKLKAIRIGRVGHRKYKKEDIERLIK